MIGAPEYAEHTRHDYMSGVDRGDRAKVTAEFFTPDHLVREIVERVVQTDSTVFTNPFKTALDPTCGDGQFLVEVVRKKILSGIPLELALATTYGIEMMPDNVTTCRARLRGPRLPGERANSARLNFIDKILEHNIVCAKVLFPTDSRYLGVPTLELGWPPNHVVALQDMWSRPTHSLPEFKRQLQALTQPA